MTDFLKRLPAPSRTLGNESLVAADAALASYAVVPSASRSVASEVTAKSQQRQRAPPYGSRQGWLPRSQDDFEDGGAYPEILVAQFPLDMGRVPTTAGQTVVALQTGEDGQLHYDAVIKQGLSYRSAIYSRPEDAKPKWSAESEFSKPSEEEATRLGEDTQEALSRALEKKMAVGVPRSATRQAEFIQYTPKNQAPGHNSEPPQFRHRRVPAGPPSPPPAILHSPPRKLTAKDQADWKIPPCLSNWKNQRGYTIPLDKRLNADGRHLQDVSINDKFAGLSEALYIAERSAREEIRMRNELLRQKREQEENVREQQLRELASKARSERAAFLKDTERDEGSTRDKSTANQSGSAGSVPGDVGELSAAERMKIERERRREVERDLRLERAGKKGKRARDENRDVSERVALGQAKPTSQEGLFDSRLFNQSAGLDTGYNAGDDEKYAVYDKPLFTDRSSQSTYRYDRERMEQSLGSKGSLPAFAGADTQQRQRTAPVEFEKDSEDPFGLEKLMELSKKSRKS